MSALGTVTVFPSLRRYSTSIWATTVSSISHTFMMWWVRPSIVEKKPATVSFTAARPVTGSALPKRNVTSGVRWATNLSGSKASMSAKTLAASRLIMRSLIGNQRDGSAIVGQLGRHWPRRVPLVSTRGLLVGEEGLGRRGAPQVRRDLPVAGDPGVVDLVDVGEPLDPRTPGIRVVVEEVRADRVAAQAPPGLASPSAHPVSAERDRVDGGHLEAGVVEPAVRAADEPEDVVVAGPGVEERHEAADTVTDPQPQHLGIEVGHLLGLRSEQQRVAQPARQHVFGGPLPLRDPDPLPAGADVGQHFRDRPGGRRALVEKLHGRAVWVAYPKPVFRGAHRGLGDRRARPFQRFPYGVQRAGAQRERDVVQPLDPGLHQPDLLLVAAGTLADKRPVLLPGLQAKILQEAFCHR